MTETHRPTRDEIESTEGYWHGRGDEALEFVDFVLLRLLGEMNHNDVLKVVKARLAKVEAELGI